MTNWKTNFSSLGLLWLRILMGVGIGYHGYGKVFSGMMDKFAEGVGGMGFPFPHFFAWACALSEFLGGILIVLGLATRIAALFLFISMSVAIFIHHLHDPLKFKELALAYWTMAGTLILTGAGPISLDDLIYPLESQRDHKGSRDYI